MKKQKQKQNKNYETIISFLHILYENVTWHLNIRLRGTQKKNKQTETRRQSPLCISLIKNVTCPFQKTFAECAKKR